jgi:hopanoid-associated phosphorylase
MIHGPDRLIIAVCGLKAEAKLAAGPGVLVMPGGGDSWMLEASLRQLAPHARALVSFGIAGGLAPGLKPGTCLVASSVVCPRGENFETHTGWRESLAGALGGAAIARFAGVDVPLADRAGKRALHLETGAVLVDMESHIVARVARAHTLPFAAIRVVADPAGRRLPHAATVGMRTDGRVDIPAVLRSLARDPRQVPDLFRTALDARAAFAGLFRSRQMLPSGFGLFDFGDPLLYMA